MVGGVPEFSFELGVGVVGGGGFGPMHGFRQANGQRGDGKEKIRKK